MFAMKSSDWRELAAYRATGMTPEQVTQMQQYTTDPAPLPMYAPIGEDDSFSCASGLLENDEYMTMTEEVKELLKP